MDEDPEYGLDVQILSNTGLYTEGWTLISSAHLRESDCVKPETPCKMSGRCVWGNVIHLMTTGLEKMPNTGSWPESPNRLCDSDGNPIVPNMYTSRLYVGLHNADEISVEEVTCVVPVVGDLYHYLRSTLPSKDPDCTMVSVMYEDVKSVLFDVPGIIADCGESVEAFMDLDVVGNLFRALHVIGIVIDYDENREVLVGEDDDDSIEYYSLTGCITEAVQDLASLLSEGAAVATAVFTVSLTLEPSSTNGGRLAFTKKAHFTVHNVNIHV